MLYSWLLEFPVVLCTVSISAMQCKGPFVMKDLSAQLLRAVWVDSYHLLASSVFSKVEQLSPRSYLPRAHHLHNPNLSPTICVQSKMTLVNHPGPNCSHLDSASVQSCLYSFPSTDEYVSRLLLNKDHSKGLCLHSGAQLILCAPLSS